MKLLISLCLLGLCIAVVSSEHLSSTLGVSPADAALYKSNTPFTCKGNQKTIPHDYVNDDYCDCLDGSDEPGTSACANGKFYCINKSYKGEFISSSKVGDSICDCCDGSDEYNGKTQCRNTCAEKGALLKRAAEEERKRYEEGVRKRKENTERATRELKEKREELESLKSQLQTTTQEEAKLNEIKSKLQEVENEKRRLVEESLLEKRYENLPADAQNTENTEQTEQAQPSESENQGTQEQDEYVEPPVEETHQDIPEWSEDELAQISDAIQTEREEREKAVRSWEQTLDKKNELDRKVTSLEKILSQNFGPEGEFYHMYEKCYDYKTKEYTYSVCPFDRASQHSTSLGNWEKWETNNGVITAMIFSNGQQCWGGPKRSLKVELECGGDDTVTDLQEPGKCEYVAKMSTPAACNPKHLEVLKINEQSGHVHDELKHLI
eukprot:TRINITY_DN3556_c0_g1_i2.p1 TRINITY_DN3556_c0_g1~~TRINITY_DN3556_c0_g1_i2.p1  ORF type:complete len:438 (-),score=93.44 TRINITY_DN3556_c0_g1_i2:182-1495(-)